MLDDPSEARVQRGKRSAEFRSEAEKFQLTGIYANNWLYNHMILRVIRIKKLRAPICESKAFLQLYTPTPLSAILCAYMKLLFY
jgi:hypothetical protein